MTTRGGMVLWCCVALVLVRVAVVGIALGQNATDGSRRTVLPGDVRRFHRIASRRGTPYADFAVEYPPITLGAIEALDGRTVRDATVHVMWSQVALDAVVALLLAWGWGRRAAFDVPAARSRVPLVPVPVPAPRPPLRRARRRGLALARRRAVIAGGALVGIACFAKIWPLALAPGVRGASELASARRVRSRSALAGSAAWIVWAGTDGPVQVLTFRGAPGWQIESTVGAVVHVFAHADARMEQGAARIGVVPDWARLGLPALALVGVAGVWWLVHRRPSAPVHVVDGVAPVAAVSASPRGRDRSCPRNTSRGCCRSPRSRRRAAIASSAG